MRCVQEFAHALGIAKIEAGKVVGCTLLNEMSVVTVNTFEIVIFASTRFCNVRVRSA